MPELPDIAPDIAADRLQTPLMRVSANGRIDYLNPAAAAWLVTAWLVIAAPQCWQNL